MKLKKWELALLLALAVTILCGGAVSRRQRDLSEKLIRLHVVAHSDGAEDQALKLQVRDELMARLEPLLEGVSDRSAASLRIDEALPDIARQARAVVRAQGYDYDVTARLCEEDFPTRTYDTFALPAGTYLSLRVVIGDGAGQNWWCVVFPPLCVSAAAGSDPLAAGLTPEQVRLITSEEPQYVLKFKSIELLARLKAFFGL